MWPIRKVTPVMVTPVTISMKNASYMLEGIKPHVVNHLKLTKSCNLINFYSKKFLRNKLDHIADIYQKLLMKSWDKCEHFLVTEKRQSCNFVIFLEKWSQEIKFFQTIVFCHTVTPLEWLQGTTTFIIYLRICILK